eukprot:14806109-Alexandrium_andersonii.AAC.1
MPPLPDWAKISPKLLAKTPAQPEMATTSCLPLALLPRVSFHLLSTLRIEPCGTCANIWPEGLLLMRGQSSGGATSWKAVKRRRAASCS